MTDDLFYRATLRMMTFQENLFLVTLYPCEYFKMKHQTETKDPVGLNGQI